MKYAAVLIFSIAFPSFVCSAQHEQRDTLEEGPFKAALSLHATDSAELYIIESSCFNPQNEVRAFRYEYLIQKQDANNNRSQIQVGDTFQLGPKEKRIIGFQQVEVSSGSILKISLAVFEQKRMIATDTLFKIFPKKVSKNPPIQDAEIRKPDDTDPNLFLDFSGFVIDETRTRAGRDLYDLFYTRWLSFDNVQGDYTIRFEELPFRGLNTILKVYLNDEQKVEQVIQPNYDFLESFADWLSSFLQFHVQQLKQVENDLEEELIGTDVDVY